MGKDLGPKEMRYPVPFLQETGWDTQTDRRISSGCDFHSTVLPLISEAGEAATPISSLRKEILQSIHASHLPHPHLKAHSGFYVALSYITLCEGNKHIQSVPT